MNKYEVLGVVGEGAYGVVLKCLNKETKEIMAIKKFKESEEDENIRKNAHREVKVLKQLKHRNIVDLREAFRRKGKLYLVFEYVEKCLLEVIEENKGGSDPELIRSIIYQLLLALDFLHKNNVLHRDIKPENLLLSKDGILKLCDFGFARTIPDGKDELTDYVATRWYRPPELLLNSKNYDRSVDLWATACIMGELIDSKPLFPGEDDLDQLYLIQRTLGKLTGAQLGLLLQNPKFKGKLVTTNIDETLEDRYKGKISQSGLDFMSSLLKIDPKHRLTTEQALNHPYFEGMRAISSLKEIAIPASKLLTSSLSTNVTKGDGAALQGDFLTRNDSKNEELAFKKGGQSVESQASTQHIQGGAGIAGHMTSSQHGPGSVNDQNNHPQQGYNEGEMGGSPIKQKAKFKVPMPMNKQQQGGGAVIGGQFGNMAASQGHLQLGAPTMYVNPALQSQHIQFGNQQRGLEITNGMNYHQPMMTFDGAPKKKHGESFQHLNNKRNQNVKSLKTFYNPATMGTSVNPSSTMISVPRNASIITGTQIPSLQASNSNSKVVKQKLYPFADHHLAPKNMTTIQNFRDGDSNQPIDGNAPMTNKRGGGGNHDSNNSLLPAIHIKNLNNTSNSSQFMKQLSTIASTYNIPFPKMKHEQGVNGPGGSVNGQQTGGNGGGAMTNPRNVYNSNLYNYTITNGVTGNHTNGRVATKVMN